MAPDFPIFPSIHLQNRQQRDNVDLRQPRLLARETRFATALISIQTAHACLSTVIAKVLLLVHRSPYRRISCLASAILHRQNYSTF